MFPARQRGLVDRNGAGLRLVRIGRHGGRPSEKFPTDAAREPPSKSLEGAAPSAPIFPARPQGLVDRTMVEISTGRMLHFPM